MPRQRTFNKHRKSAFLQASSGKKPARPIPPSEAEASGEQSPGRGEEGVVTMRIN